MPALPNNSLVGLLLDEPPPGRGDARLKPCEPREVGPIDARALADLPPPADGAGDGLGLGLDGGRIVAIGCSFNWAGELQDC